MIVYTRPYLHGVKATSQDLDRYQAALDSKLADTVVPGKAVLCQDKAHQAIISPSKVAQRTLVLLMSVYISCSDDFLKQGTTEFFHYMSTGYLRTRAN
jgi:hypothetical protein